MPIGADNYQWSLTCVSVWTVRGEMLLVSVQPIRTQNCQEMKLNIKEEEGGIFNNGGGGTHSSRQLRDFIHNGRGLKVIVPADFQ